jgi:hypothetical protein
MRFGMDRWDRIENGVGVGMPDINYCLSGIEGWIEMKSPSVNDTWGASNSMTMPQTSPMSSLSTV